MAHNADRIIKDGAAKLKSDKPLGEMVVNRLKAFSQAVGHHADDIYHHVKDSDIPKLVSTLKSVDVSKITEIDKAALDVLSGAVDLFLNIINKTLDLEAEQATPAPAFA
jgi:hypothetical protein